MGFLGLFKLHLFDPDAFDKELTALTQAISKTRNQITALSIKRKSVRNNVAYALVIAYGAWVAYRYRMSLSNLGPLAVGKSRLSVFLSGQDTSDLLWTVLVPIVIAIVVYLVDSLFRLWIASKEKSMASLLKRHRAKIEELKRITNFNTTSLLLRKYSKLEGNEPMNEAKKGAGDLEKKPLAGKKPQTKILPPTVNRPDNQGKSGDQARPDNPVQRAGQRPNQAIQSSNRPDTRPDARPDARRSPPVQGSIHKSLQDRLLDYIIGSDHNESVESRYALICAHCYTHNGLAPPGCTDPHSVTYICRHCGYINGALETPSSDGGDSGNAANSASANPTFMITSPSGDGLSRSSDEKGRVKENDSSEDEVVDKELVKEAEKLIEEADKEADEKSGEVEKPIEQPEEIIHDVADDVKKAQ